MENQQIILVLAVMAVSSSLGILVGYLIRHLIQVSKKDSADLKIKTMILEAKEESQRILEAAEKKSEARIAELRKEEKEKEAQIAKMEERLMKREDALDRRQTDLDEENSKIKRRVDEIRSAKEALSSREQGIESELERVAGLSAEEAKTELLSHIEKNYEEDLIARLHKLETEGFERLDRKAKEILTTSIHRLANSTVAEVMTTSVTIPSDEIKGKIIGKEGRNIRAFEKASGVELIVDDTPGSVIISSFDPVRRQVARVALENLIIDGRIQPAKIEETVEKAREEINKIIKEKGEQAAYECGVYNLDPRIISILGRLYFRTSYGQNVLQHSIEMSHISGMLAEELGADIQVAKAGALLHDIGKAVDHEIQGTHVEIGRRILQKFGADEAIIKAMQAHHEEYPYETVESIIVQAADAISGGRPGARRDSVENYLKRLGDLEAIADSFEGVERTFALQAGREIRVFVHPSEITDYQATQLAREIAARVESELKYPGEIKIAVFRETRAIEYAR